MNSQCNSPLRPCGSPVARSISASGVTLVEVPEEGVELVKGPEDRHFRMRLRIDGRLFEGQTACGGDEVGVALGIARSLAAEIREFAASGEPLPPCFRPVRVRPTPKAAA